MTPTTIASPTVSVPLSTRVRLARMVQALLSARILSASTPNALPPATESVTPGQGFTHPVLAGWKPER
ncbi:MAG TPA: hypothetical protein VNZ55_06140 [Thermomicrobiales bacterium]|nr:hypothetical protein [Thermomicrobiales bacterium]